MFWKRKEKKEKGQASAAATGGPASPPLGLFPPLTRPNPSPGRTRVPSPFFLSPTDSWAPSLLSLRRGTRASAPLSFFPQPSSNRTRDPRHRILPNPDLGGICLPRAPIKSLDRLRVAPFPSAPQKRSPRSLARRGVESAEAASIPHRGASSQSPLGPSNDPRRLRGELLDLPAFFVQRKVLEVGRTASSGPPAMVPLRRRPTPVAGRRPPFSGLISAVRLKIDDQETRILLCVHKLLKRPSVFPK